MRAKAPEAREGNARSSAQAPPALPTASAAIAPPVAPFHLDERAERVWDAVWEAGGGAYVPATDSFAIERYAELQSRRRGFLFTLDDEGWVTTGSQGQEVVHPAAKLLAECERQLLPLEDRLGLNPESRLRLGLSAAEMKSALDRFADEPDDYDDD
jgi:P27 family predicted phage terminase small subunit